MNIQDPDQKNITLLDKFKSSIKRGNKLLEKPELSYGMINMWISYFKVDLKKLYGPDISKLFPNISKSNSSLPPKICLQQKISQLNQFVEMQNRILSILFNSNYQKKVFIGHGRSYAWHELKDFLSDRLMLPWDEFNRESVAGLTTFERLSTMLDEASFAFLIMTAEDEQPDATYNSRQNVTHEVGLFQGRLGPKKAIILLEEGCNEFSNIIGLSQIRFPKNYISASFEEIRRVLEREKILQTNI